MTRFHPMVSEFPSSRFFTMRNKHVEDEMLKVKNNTLSNTCDLSARFLTNIRVCVRMDPLPASSTSYWPLAAISSPSGSSMKTSLTCSRPPIMSSPRRERQSHQNRGDRADSATPGVPNLEQQEEEGTDRYSISSRGELTDFCNTPPTLE